ncbi:LacI family DNA-binding transcriptional regulator [Bilifractor sp. LCP19S3_H10]|uniref:LacI family DNA-binding transcriptional regulator n=1 Tax=Bilifractor sp. LCP19S3_H10 TaxID=3438736 RepID=UPI003F91F4FE
MSENNTRQKPNIKMVAQKAGVSVGSVSNYLNHSTKVSTDMAHKIENAISSLDYSPDYVAASLRRKKSTNIMVLSPNLNNTFYTKTLSTYTKLAVKNGYYIQTFGYEYSPEIERNALKRAKANKVCLVVVFNGYDDEREIDKLVSSGVPVILADRMAGKMKVNSVAFNNNDVFKEMIFLLKSKGYKRLGILTEPLTLLNLKRRYDNVKRISENNNIQCGETELFCDESLRLDNFQNGYIFMTKILEENPYEILPKCWLCSSDNLAIGALKAFKEKHYQVPDDFSIIGFDNIAFSSFVNPQLTTVDQNQQVLGEKLWEMTEITLSGDISGNEMIIPQQLVLRESF